MIGFVKDQLIHGGGNNGRGEPMGTGVKMHCMEWTPFLFGFKHICFDTKAHFSCIKRRSAMVDFKVEINLDNVLSQNRMD